MAKRGRKSAASLAIASQLVTVCKEDRQEPPRILSDAEREIWVTLVEDQPANTFTATHRPMLTHYCQHIVRGQILADKILNVSMAELETFDGLKKYDLLTKMAERETRAAASLATRLRITRQATVHPVTAGRALGNKPKGGNPWDDDD